MTGTRIHLSPPHVTDLDREALLRAFDSGWVAPAGPEIGGFEDDLARFVGRDPGTVAALSSGSAALQMALAEVGVQSGSVVLVQTFTFIASAAAAVALGAEPVFVDSERATWNLSPELLDDEIRSQHLRGRRVSAVVSVDLYGRVADHDRIQAICDEHGIPHVEDAAEALGSSAADRMAGTFGGYGVLSFNGNKIITTSGGGALICPDAESAARIRYLATQARQSVAWYEHTEIGHNFRLSNLLAALGRSQLQQLPERIVRRREIRARYARLLTRLADVTVVAADRTDDNAWLTCLLLPEGGSEIVRLALEAEDIEARPLWKPMHLQPVFASAERRVDGTSEELFRSGLCIPSGSSMTDDDVDRVAAVIIEALR